MVELTWPDAVILAAVVFAVVVLAEVPHLYRQPAPCARRTADTPATSGVSTRPIAARKPTRKVPDDGATDAERRREDAATLRRLAADAERAAEAALAENLKRVQDTSGPATAPASTAPGG